MKSALTIIVFIFISFVDFGQNISGTVSDYFSKKPLDAVTVQTSSGHYAISDSLGKYTISVLKKDSVWFSYLNKQTVKYKVDTINHPESFDIALYVDARWLPEVKVATRDYKLDSLTNRQEYAKAFNYRKPGLRLSESNNDTYDYPSSFVPGGLTVGFDLDAIIDAFNFKKTRRAYAFQQRLIQDEHDKYVDHRFTKYIVKKLTALDGDDLTKFMVYYRPTYEELLMFNDIELGVYIENCLKDYRVSHHN